MNWIKIILLVFLPCVIGVSSIPSQVQRMENQFTDNESIPNEKRKTDIKTIMKRLEEIEGKLEENAHKDQVHNKSSIINVLLNAFQSEKEYSRRTRRDVENLNTESVKTSELLKGLKNQLLEIHKLTNTTLDKFDHFLDIEEWLMKREKRSESCLQLLNDGYTANGVYEIYPGGRATPIKVYCDQTTDGGGWTVFQRREDGSENFYRNWKDYKIGFGNPEWEFWLGNEYIHTLTSPCCRELRVDMADFDNDTRFANYGQFSVGSMATKYAITVGNYSGDAGSSLSWHNGMAFSTMDQDNDVSEGNCAALYKGAWWYNKCHGSNLNGHYHLGDHKSYADGVNWVAFRGAHYSLKFTEMKFR